MYHWALINKQQQSLLVSFCGYFVSNEFFKKMGNIRAAGNDICKYPSQIWTNEIGRKSKIEKKGK